MAVRVPDQFRHAGRKRRLALQSMRLVVPQLDLLIHTEGERWFRRVKRQGAKLPGAIREDERRQLAGARGVK